MSVIFRRTAVLFIFVLVGCGGSGGGDGSGDINDSEGANAFPNSDTIVKSDLVGEIPPGNVKSYGAITVGDDAGIASDLVAAFFKVDEGLSADFLANVFSSNKTLCTVDDDDSLDFEEFSSGFIPSFNGVQKQAISAGEIVTLTSAEGTFASIESGSSGAFLFYTLPNSQSLPSGSIPDDLQIDVPGDVYPAYQAVMMPSVQALGSVVYSGNASITSDTAFGWEPADQAGSMVRVFSSTAGGFFTEDGVTVTCLAPDTGSFVFPEPVRAELGDTFVGSKPIFSRVRVITEVGDESVLFLIRESFVD